jgi:heat shock protein HtpX
VRRAGALNVVKAWSLVGILAVLLGSLGWLLGGPRTGSLFAFCAVLAGIAVYWYGDRALLGSLGARPYALAEGPLLRSTTDRLAAGLGISPPRLYLLDDGFPRAFAVGRGPRSSALAVSVGLLSALNAREVEAVLAHELAHVRARDVLTQTFAVLLAVTLVEVSRIGGWLSRALLFVLAPVAAAFVHLLLSPRRELAADRAAAALVDSPHDLADALLRLDEASDLVQFSASPASEPLYTVNPFGDDKMTRMFSTHPPLAERVAILRGEGLGGGPAAG